MAYVFFFFFFSPYITFSHVQYSHVQAVDPRIQLEQSSITRSSQPMVGFKNARSIQDEKLIEAIFHSHSLHTGPVAVDDQPTQQVVYGATPSNLIIDARPTTNAMANTIKGAGNMEYYKGFALVACCIYLT